MSNSELLRAIAKHCRQSHVSALFVVGWFAAASTDEDLQRLLDAIHEAERALGPDMVPAAYGERYGLVHDPRD
jgi:hypothetical protein